MNKINLEQDIEEFASTNKSELSQVANIAKDILYLQKEIADLELVLHERGEELARLTTQTLPDLMGSFGLSEFTLASGEEITIKPFINASIPSESAIEKAKSPEEKQALRDRMERAFAFLNANNGGAIIKSNLKAELGKGADKMAKAALAFLEGLGVPASITRGVHPGTLNAWIRERMGKGLPVDMETLRVHTGKIAEIKRPK